METIRLAVNYKLATTMDDLIKRSGSADLSEMINKALALLEWAVKQKEAGRLIGSVDEEAESFRELEF
jgi:hypothetical protein